MRALNERLERQKSPDDIEDEDEDDKWPTMEDNDFDTTASSSVASPSRDTEVALLTSTPTDTTVDEISEDATTIA